MNRFIIICNKTNFFRTSIRKFSGELGSGAGKGGGSGGTIREAGGSFGKAEAAREEEYFRRQSKEGLEKMRDAMKLQQEEIEKQIQKHDAELERLGEIQ